MYSVSNNYIDAVRANTRQDRLLTTLTFPTNQVLNLTDDDYGQGSIGISWQCVDGEELMFGSAYTTALEISIRTNVSRYKFYGATIEPVYQVLTDAENNTWESVPLGIFTVAEATRVGSLVKMTAYDNMQAFDVEWGSRVITGTPYEMLDALCDEVGLTLVNTQASMLTWPNGDYSFQLDETNGCSKLRDGLKFICQLIGGFAVIDRAGRLEIKRFHTTPDIMLTENDRYKSEIADYTCSYVGLSVTGLAGTYSASSDDPEATGLHMIIEDAAAWDRGAPLSLQSRTNKLFRYLQTINYTPIDVSMPGDPTFECGDMVTIAVGEEELNTILTSVSWGYRKQMTFGSVGQNPYFAGTTASVISSERVLSLQSETNKIVMYTTKNKSDLNISSMYQDICKFAFSTLGAADVIFQATLILDVTPTEPSSHEVTLSQYFVDDTATEVDLSGVAACPGEVVAEFQYLLDAEPQDYFPKQTFTEGRHTYVLFYPCVGLESLQLYSWQTQMKCTGGTIKILENNLRAILWGQKLSAQEIPWDGILNILEYVDHTSFGSTDFTIQPIMENVDVNLVQTEFGDYTEIVPQSVLLGISAYAVQPIYENVYAGRKTSRMVIDIADYTEYTFNGTYVNVTDVAFTLRIDYDYVSGLETIDSGHLTSMTIALGDFDTISSLTITSDAADMQYRATTSGDTRVTEDGNKRVVED